MERIRLAFLILMAASIISLPQSTAGRAADAVPLALADSTNIVGVVNQAGTTPDTLRFYSANNPEVPIAFKTVVGLLPGEKTTGAAYDPDTDSLIGVTNVGNVIRIDLETGQAGLFEQIPSDFTQGTVAVDFDPETKELTIVNDEGMMVKVNFSRNPPFVVKPLPSYNSDDSNTGKTPVLAGITNNKTAGTTGGKTFFIDSRQDVLAALDPDTEKLKTIAALGVNTTSRVGLSAVPGSLFAFAALQLEGEERSKLFRINLAEGTTSEIGSLGGGQPVGDIFVRFQQQQQQDEVTCEVTPEDATNLLGETHTIKVVVKKNGEPLVGAIVLVGILVGPHTGVNGEGETEDDPETEEKEGQFQFGYVGTKVGLDTISVTVLAEGKIFNKAVTKLWKAPDLQISDVKISGKKMTVTGCCFQEGDKIIVNDKEQATKNSADSPATTLIAKKGAKKLKACQNGFTNLVIVRRARPGAPVQDTEAFATCP